MRRTSFMTVRKFIFYSLISIILILIICTRILLWNKKYDFESIAFLAGLLLAFWVLGIFLGMFLSIIFQKPEKEFRIYLWSQVAVFCCLISIFVYHRIDDWVKEKKYGNIEFNHDLVELTYPDNEHSIADQNVKNAFLILASTYSDPNSFRLEKWFVLDSIIYFRYQVKENTYYSNFEILSNSSLKTKTLNGNPKVDQNFIAAERIHKNILQDEMNKFYQTISELPDSTKAELLKSIKGK